jgi:aldehyde:ferredoxin oxidoreductase
MPEAKKSGKGYWGRILWVDLSGGKTFYEDIADSLYEKFLSGAGLGAKILWDRQPAGVGPLGPENILGFTTGLLTDTGSLFSGRFTVVGKSPLSGGWGEANAGGYFSPWLKRCGFDGLFFSGAGAAPVYLYLDDQTAELRDAADLWGADALDTEVRLKERYGSRVQVACIGPAGEKKSCIAGIVTDRGRIAARSGLGGVMGAKNLKAIVVAGTQRVGVSDRAGIHRLSKAFQERISGKKGLSRFLTDGLLGTLGKITRRSRIFPRQPAHLWRLLLSKYGTTAITAMSAESGDSPVKNWGGVGYLDFPLSRSQKIGAETVRKYEIKKYGCYSCPLHCGGIMQVADGPFPIPEMHKIEYETLCAFGSLLLLDDLPIILKVNDLLNRAGMDSISCGGTVAFAIECFENGILTREDCDGLELRWGSGPAILGLTEKIIARQGLGDVLADGVKRAAEKIGRGSERFAVHCGGVEPPMHDPKFDPGFGTAYACEATPGRHTTASYTYLDLQVLEKKFKQARKIPAITTRKEKYRTDNKGIALTVDAFYKMLIDGAGVCLFGTQIGGIFPLTELLNAAAGWSRSPDDYLVIGERIAQLRQAFNLREGLNPRKDFRLHPRLYGDPALPKGPAKGITLDMESLTEGYYRALHWDPQTGRPEKEHLLKLGLEEVAAELYPAGDF